MSTITPMERVAALTRALDEMDDLVVTLRAQLAAEQARAERAEALLRRVRETYNHLGAPVTMTLQNDIDAALAAESGEP